ncbi:hypothetical protein DSOUD_0828 [Desulfuromonas soudanensis]|uniref:Nucleoid-associated protein YejK n=1 Tax=Desulfuromonas soudanensis TaxID=1603606 RepID=A0A0M4CYW7_9BACT|nr:nucleoid-associated protein [Desulfuromonas soudanensis]ALC15615.1 hypothetical protein DSOUD_0828 [Desulfuromonas soudanensis]
MARESVLLTTHKDSLIIEDFIFHVILKDEETPRYFDAVTFRSQSQRDFFKEIILLAAVGTQYVFADPENSDFVQNCQEIIANPAERFVPLSRTLANSFRQLHIGHVNDGVFIAARVSMLIDGHRQSFISLLKVDYANVLQHVRDRIGTDDVVTFNEITESIAEDKKTIQKWAFIDVGNHFGWDVLAQQRGRLGKQADTTEAIADYFKQFLGVTERETDSVLTRAVVQEASAWARQQEGLPEIPNNYKARAFDYMGASDNFDTDDFINLVVRDEDPERKQRLMGSLREHLAAKGLAGQTFTPRAGSLIKSQKKNTLKTTNGVTLTWEGQAEDRGIMIEQERKNGYKHITIRTPDFDLT